MPFVVPTLSASWGTRAGTTSLFGTLSSYAGKPPLSRLGTSLGTYPPLGLINGFMAWGFVAGIAPTGTTSLTILAAEGGERGGACSLQGAASAWCELFISVEELVARLRADPPSI